MTVKHVTTGAGVIDLTRLGVIGLALLVAVPLPSRRPRLRPPSRPRRSAPAARPVETVGRRARLAPPPPAELVVEQPLGHLESLEPLEPLEPVEMPQSEFFAGPEAAGEPDAEATAGSDELFLPAPEFLPSAVVGESEHEPWTEPEPVAEGTS